jgi:hypothetical protein
MSEKKVICEAAKEGTCKKSCRHGKPHIKMIVETHMCTTRSGCPAVEAFVKCVEVGR